MIIDPATSIKPPRFHLADARQRGDRIVKLISAFDLSGDSERYHVVGSIRRGKPLVKDIDLVVLDTPEFRDAWCEFALMRALDLNGQKAKRFMYEGIPVDLYIAADPVSYAMTKLIRTGSAAHNRWLCARARQMGLQIKPSDGLFVRDAVKPLDLRTEEEIFAELGLPYIHPADREMNALGPL